ncbi:MAG: hypothetical protein ACE5HL_09175 [Terriglobia bacterium]
MLVIGVEVNWTTRQGERAQEHAETEVVNAYGARLQMKGRAPPCGEIELRRPKIGQSTRARVLEVSKRSPDGLTRVTVELEVPSESFWGVTIPPLPGAAAR